MSTVTFFSSPTTDKMNVKYKPFYVLFKMLQLATKWLQFLKDDIHKLKILTQEKAQKRSHFFLAK